jgi:hypothetical protein
MEFGTKNDYAGEVQFQFTWRDLPNKESRLTTEELLETVFSLLPDLKFYT